MEQRYAQIGLEERCEIARLQSHGLSIRQVAATLDRAPSTIAREVRRNSGHHGRYQPVYADQQSRARRWTGSMLDRDTVLREIVLSQLGQGWSPEQVAGRLAQQTGRKAISYETIYRFIYAQIARTKDYAWRQYLPWKKHRRGRRSRKASSSASCITLRRPISERPLAANDRGTPGHWEADLMLFRIRRQAILTLHERRSLALIAVRLKGKAADPIANAMTALLAQLPPPWRQTVTFDNGTEFALHHQLHALDIQTFFCDTYSPWQKGGIENAIGRMRRTLPRKTDLATLSEKHFLNLIQAYNNTPRKCLDFQTPAEFFWDELLHFKCESSFPPSRE
jgi:IS30 family transposase